ncbi:MAG TPA: YciI family protein [Candidatus Cybelea sp.]|nr:YciI family protein [Candidatus Cybelea sp.]
MKYVLNYTAAEDVLSKAPLHVAAHREHWKRFVDDGTLLMIGPFSDPNAGAMAVFTAREAAEEFAAGDPFVREGVVTSWRIQEWAEALGWGSKTAFRLYRAIRKIVPTPVPPSEAVP